MAGVRRALAAMTCAFLLGCGCGANEDSTPAACLGPSAAYLAALRDAPGEVRLAGGVPISSCLVENQEAGELTRLGVVLVETTTTLNARARRAPGGAANVELGYLVGAVEQGAKHTSGIHSDLVRRIEAAATFSPAGRPHPR